MIEAQLPLYFLSSKQPVIHQCWNDSNSRVDHVSNKRASSRVDLELRISRATNLGLACWLKQAGKDTIKLLENGGLRNMVLSSKSEPLVARIGTKMCPSLQSSVKQPAYGTEQETGRYAGMVTGHHGIGHDHHAGHHPLHVRRVYLKVITNPERSYRN